MADQRNDVDLVGIGYRAVTYKIDGTTITYDATATGGSAQVGLACRLKPGAAKTVELVGDGEEIEGKIIKVEADDKASIQVEGFMTLPAGTSATLTEGKKIVGDLLVAAEGYIREVATGTAAELGVARGRIIDPTTTTAVVVYLE